MYKYFKITVFLFIAALLAMPLTGCDNPPWDSGMTLGLKVDTPKDGATVSTSSVTVSGRVHGTESKGAKVQVNNADVPVNDGKYSTEVTLVEGTNVINIAATAGQANLKEKLTVTYKK